MGDRVDHPAHYVTDEGIECIDMIMACMGAEAYQGFLKGNVIKYIWREGLKGDALEDLEKAEWYLKRLIGFKKARDDADGR